MRFHLALALVGAIALAGCEQPGTGTTGPGLPGGKATPAASLPDAPKYGDALAGLYLLPADVVPADRPVNYYAPGGGTGKPGRAVLVMSLVPGPNYGKLRTYLDEAKKSAGSTATDLQLQPVLTSAVTIIKQHYAWIEFADSLEAARERHASLTFVLDIRGSLGARGAAPTTVQIEIIAFNDRFEPVARIDADGSSTDFGGAHGYGFQDAAKAALNVLQEKSQKYFN